MPQGGSAQALERRGPVARRERIFPVGAEMLPGGGIGFRVWAPKAERLFLELVYERKSEPLVFEMMIEENGYFFCEVEEARSGMRYRYRLGEQSFPDPASRFQPDGPHGASEIVDPTGFAWTDQDWPGVPRGGQVLYEMHIGTFTSEGTWAAAAAELAELKDVGITVIEMMPVADFPGRFGWGYDGVSLFAPTRLYGRPDELRAFVNRAHELGLGVILDVVYNHLGPDGNYLRNYSDDYFTDRYANEWGQAINFDGPNSGPVREFFLANAAYWIKEFHFDGLRLDATHQIFDSSPAHILAELSKQVRSAGGRRKTYLVSENEPQQARLIRAFEKGGYGMDALWNDDFHHSATVALTGHKEAYYSDYRGTPQELISCAKRGFLFQGQWCSWQKKPRGSSAAGLEPEQFINFIQNHDQVANSLRGLRLHQLTTPGRFRALTALLLLGPATPMLFQGQEFDASAPFLFFADHNPELARLVAKGRRDFLRQFPSIEDPQVEPCLAEPAAEETFLSCKLNLAERHKNSATYRLHRDLLKLRREDPTFSRPGCSGIDGAVLAREAFVLRFFGEDGEDRLLLVNLGRELNLTSAAEPLMAPAEGSTWRLMWSSESPVYGGGGTPGVGANGVRELPGHAALVFRAESGQSI